MKFSKNTLLIILALFLFWLLVLKPRDSGYGGVCCGA